jgi:NADH:ubiquinone oxidoreductase subunit C
MENQETMVTETEAQETEVKNFTFTQEELDALLQRETDKRVTSALKTQQKKYEKQLSLSKLDDEAREKAEKDARIQELEEMLRDRDIANNKSELKSVLSARGLSAEFADIITITDDIEESQARIDTLDKLFKAAVRNEVERRLAAAGGTPKGNGNNSGELTPEAFSKLPLREQNALYKTNPELYKKLTK